ncbi:MAG: glycosyl transferase [Prevotella sp.]|nr:glycosyl transferase [Prevotella sp.]
MPSIPKTIHYCWFGRNPLPPLAVKCIESWKRYLPDYEIREWNEDNFDVNAIDYTREAYESGKYAFVSDYARFAILYQHGGVYFDTDVEVVRPIDDLLAQGPLMGIEKDSTGNDYPAVAPGLGLASYDHHPLYREMLDFYATLHFKRPDGSLDMTTIVDYTTAVLRQHGLQPLPGRQQIEGITIYPSEYFCPRNIVTKRMHLTENTRTIHHYAASWKTKTWLGQMKKRLRSFLPESLLQWYNQAKRKHF